MRKQRQGTAMQCRQFDTEVTAPGKGHKPKLWGYHKARNAAPGNCVITAGNGQILRTVKSVRVR